MTNTTITASYKLTNIGMGYTRMDFTVWGVKSSATMASVKPIGKPRRWCITYAGEQHNFYGTKKEATVQFLTKLAQDAADDALLSELIEAV